MTTDTEKLNGWSQWSKYVLKSLEDNTEVHKEMMQMLMSTHTEVVKLQVKASMWGFVAGAMPTIGIILLKLV